MLDSMTWPFMEAMGDWAIPLAWLFALFTGCPGRDQRR
jgi:ribose transport system permease protein